MEGYYTVSEFAERHGKDPGNVRRLLIKGEIAGEKIGRQWIIPEGAEYPVDRRVKSGVYCGWRRKHAVFRKNRALVKGILAMCEELNELCGVNAKRVLLYGSYVRGEETAESDLDLAIILSGKLTEDQHDRLMDISVEYELELGVTLSILTIDEKELEEWKEVIPFYRNLYKEGIELWKAA